MLPASGWALPYARSMSISIDAIPQAVADIVTACYIPIFGTAKLSTPDGAVSQDEMDDIEKRIISFTDRLTRIMVKAIVDAQAGNR